jgi:hypothetical protein
VSPSLEELSWESRVFHVAAGVEPYGDFDYLALDLQRLLLTPPALSGSLTRQTQGPDCSDGGGSAIDDNGPSWSFLILLFTHWIARAKSRTPEQRQTYAYAAPYLDDLLKAVEFCGPSFYAHRLSKRRANE